MFISLYLLILPNKTVGACHFNGVHISGALDLIVQPPFDLSALDNFSNFLYCNKKLSNTCEKKCFSAGMTQRFVLAKRLIRYFYKLQEDSSSVALKFLSVN